MKRRSESGVEIGEMRRILKNKTIWVEVCFALKVKRIPKALIEFQLKHLDPLRKVIMSFSIIFIKHSSLCFEVQSE